jgi:hypothetical protein
MYPHRVICNDVTICNVVTLPRNYDSINMYAPRSLRFNFWLGCVPTTNSIKSGSFVIYKHFQEEFTVKMSCDKHVYIYNVTHTHTHTHKHTHIIYIYMYQIHKSGRILSSSFAHLFKSNWLHYYFSDEYSYFNITIRVLIYLLGRIILLNH